MDGWVAPQRAWMASGSRLGLRVWAAGLCLMARAASGSRFGLRVWAPSGSPLNPTAWAASGSPLNPMAWTAPRLGATLHAPLPAAAQ